jgi:CheY-like chemotaxis protein
VPEEAAAGGALEGARLLAVDTHATNREVLEDLLEAWNVDVHTVASIEEATRVLANGRVDLVFVDDAWPNVDVDEVGRRLAEASQAPLVLYSAVPELRLDARRTGRFADVVGKPLSPSEIHDAIEQALGGPESRPADVSARVDPELGSKLGMEVLIAEDNLVNLRVVNLFLDQFGFEPDGVGDGQEALERVREGSYDVVLMHVRTPRLDGLEATRRIREETPEDRQPWIVAMTAHASEEARQSCLDAGMDAYVAKPVEFDTLREALENAARARGPLPEAEHPGTQTPANRRMESIKG